MSSLRLDLFRLKFSFVYTCNTGLDVFYFPWYSWYLKYNFGHPCSVRLDVFHFHCIYVSNPQFCLHLQCKTRRVQCPMVFYNISHKLSRPSQFLENSWKFKNGPLCTNNSVYWYSSNTEACAEKLSQIRANNVDNGGRGIGPKNYVRYCLKKEMNSKTSFGKTWHFGKTCKDILISLFLMFQIC